jgi:hypothetical protein
MCKVPERLFTLISLLILTSVAAADLPVHPLRQQLAPSSEEVFWGDPGTPPQPVHFGDAVAVRGTVALIGMPELFGRDGRVAVFERNTAGKWVRTRHFGAADGAANSLQFGRSITFRDNIAVVGSKGAAYVFMRASTGTWAKTQKLTPPTADNVVDFAVSVRYQDGFVAVGAFRQNAPGAVYVFEISRTTGKMLRRTRITANDGQVNDGFGVDVSMARDTIVVGAPSERPSHQVQNGPGAAYVFVRSGTAWLQRQKIVPAGVQAGEDFGTSVAIDSSMIVVGSPLVDVEGDGYGEPADHVAGGAAYVFVPANGVWIHQQTLRPTPEEFGGYLDFGRNVAMFGSRIVVNAAQPHGFISYIPPGVAFTYSRSGTLVQPLGSVLGFWSAFSLSLSNYTLFVGSPYEDRCPYGCTGAVSIHDIRVAN